MEDASEQQASVRLCIVTVVIVHNMEQEKKIGLNDMPLSKLKTLLYSFYELTEIGCR